MITTDQLFVIFMNNFGSMTSDRSVWYIRHTANSIFININGEGDYIFEYDDSTTDVHMKLERV